MAIKPKQIAEYTVNAGPDSNGDGWYVDLREDSKGYYSWMMPREARRLGKALIEFSKKPRRKRQAKEK